MRTDLDTECWTSMTVNRAVELTHMRVSIRREARAVGLPSERIDDVAIAVNEALSNVLLHTGGPATLRCFTVQGAFVCEVTDSGPIQRDVAPESTDVLEGLPSPRSTVGLGLPVMRGAADHMDFLPNGKGTMVRLEFKDQGIA